MKQPLSMKPMDFEQWADLAMNNPEQFEIMRQAAINEFLESVSADRRLRLEQLQWRVDRIRERCATPMAATIAISELMWESFYDLHDQYQGMFGTKTAKRYKPIKPVKSAKILPFQSTSTI